MIEKKAGERVLRPGSCGYPHKLKKNPRMDQYRCQIETVAGHCLAKSLLVGAF